MMLAMLCSGTANAVFGTACAVGEAVFYNCMKGSRTHTPVQELRFVDGFEEYEYGCPTANVHYNYLSAATHDLHYRHEEWWRNTTREEAEDTEKEEDARLSGTVH